MATGYMNFAEQQMQNTFQGAPIYRKPKYIQAGGTPINKPTTTGLENLYGAQTPALAPSTPLGGMGALQTQVPFITPTPQEGVIPTYQTPGFEEMMTGEGWEKQTNKFGVEIWFPTGAEEGSYYRGTDDQMYRYENGQWKEYESLVNADQFIITINQSTYHTAVISNMIRSNTEGFNLSQVAVAAGVSSADELVYGFVTGTITRQQFAQAVGAAALNQAAKDQLMNVFLPTLGSAMNLMTRAKELGLLDNEADFAQALIEGNQDYFKNLQDQVKSIVDENTSYDGTFNLADAMEVTEGLDVYQNFVDQAQVMSDQILSGTLDVEDIESLLGSDNAMEVWLGTVLEQSYDTGHYLGTFMDESGELNASISELIDSYDEYMVPQHEAAMKDLRLAAIQRGHSTSDVMYNKVLEGVQAGMTMEMADNIAKTIMADMEAQFTFIGNAITDMMKELMGEAEATAFSAQMQSAWDEATQQYEQGVQDLSQEIADRNAQGFGDFVSGIVGFVSSILGSIFG